MDDMLLELTAGNATLRRRLDAYADDRLSPDTATVTRMRARVMAAAHRQAALTAAGAGLTVISADAAPARSRRRHPLVRVAGLLLTAALGVSLAVGTTLAAEAGGPLYPVRLGIEAALLPADPAERAVAELQRLETRLAEAVAAHGRGDTVALAAALAAYEAILDSASTGALAADDAVAKAAIEAGVRRNLAVLTGLVAVAPEAAHDGLTRAIEHSAASIERVRAPSEPATPQGPQPGGPGEPGGPGGPGGPARPGVGPRASDAPTAKPTPRAAETPRGPAASPSDRTAPGQAPGGSTGPKGSAEDDD